MKKGLLILLCLPLLFSSCEEDEQPIVNNSNGLVEYDVNVSPNGIYNLSYINSNGITIDTVINYDWDLSFNGSSGDSVALVVSPQNPTTANLELNIYYLGTLRMSSSSSGASTTTAIVVL